MTRLLAFWEFGWCGKLITCCDFGWSGFCPPCIRACPPTVWLGGDQPLIVAKRSAFDRSQSNCLGSTLKTWCNLRGNLQHMKPLCWGRPVGWMWDHNKKAQHLCRQPQHTVIRANQWSKLQDTIVEWHDENNDLETREDLDSRGKPCSFNCARREAFVALAGKLQSRERPQISECKCRQATARTRALSFKFIWWPRSEKYQLPSTTSMVKVCCRYPVYQLNIRNGSGRKLTKDIYRKLQFVMNGGLMMWCVEMGSTLPMERQAQQYIHVLRLSNLVPPLYDLYRLCWVCTFL